MGSKSGKKTKKKKQQRNAIANSGTHSTDWSNPIWLCLYDGSYNKFQFSFVFVVISVLLLPVVFRFQHWILPNAANDCLRIQSNWKLNRDLSKWNAIRVCIWYNMAKIFVNHFQNFIYLKIEHSIIMYRFLCLLISGRFCVVDAVFLSLISFIGCF